MKYYVNDSTLSSLADTIRSKAGLSGSLAFPSSFESVINNLPNSKDLPDFDMFTVASTWNDQLSYIPSSYYYDHRSIRAAYCPKVITIYDNAFRNCEALLYAHFPSCTSIGPYAFAESMNLYDIYFPKTISVDEGAFLFCKLLSIVSLPNCEVIGQYGFNSAGIIFASLPKVEVVLRTGLADNYNLSFIELPKCRFVEEFAFVWCASLNTVLLPVVESIGSSAFASCRLLISLYLSNVSFVPRLDSSAFVSTPIGGYTAETAGRYGSVYVPSSLYTAFKTATNWSTISNRIVSMI